MSILLCPNLTKLCKKHDVDMDNVLYSKEAFYALMFKNNTIYYVKGVDGDLIKRSADAYNVTIFDYRNYWYDLNIDSFISTQVHTKYHKDLYKVFDMEIPDIKPEIWPSSKIRYAYLESNYLEHCGALGSSCMRYKRMQRSLNFYVKAGAKIVVMADKNKKILARALLWENIIYGDKKTTFLDRIYYSHDYQIKIYAELAKKNKWEQYSGRDTSQVIVKKDIKMDGIYYLPYADTLRRLIITEDGKAILSSSERYLNSSYKGKVYVLGTYDNNGYVPALDPNSVQEVFSGAYISKKDSTYVKKYKGYIFNDNIIKIKNVIYSKLDREHITRDGYNNYGFKDDIVDEKFTGVRVNKYKCKLIKKYDGYVYKENVIKVFNKQYSKYDPNLTLYEDKYYLKMQCTKINGTYVPKTKVLIYYKLKDKYDIVDELCNELIEEGEISKKDYVDKTKDEWCELLNISDDIVFEEQPVYANPSPACIKLVTGEYVIESSRRHLTRRGHRWYLKDEFVPKDKNQLEFSFMGK